tara:strand:- start:254 stop:1282 length:1029 start_codon:yes stop_codon:yes gene_type:complete
MLNKFKFRKEEKLIHKLIFEHEISEFDFENLDYEELIKIASSQLVVPLLYSKFKNLNLVNFLEDDFRKYIKEIHSINFNRNYILIKEIKEIEEIFDNEKIKFELLKGAAFVKKKIYEDIGERMIGDIDILINKNDSIKITRILENNGYFKNKPVTKFWKKKHLPRFLNIKKLFAIEIHTELIDYKKKKLLNADIFRNSKDKLRHSLYTKHTILNFQINDFGDLKGIYSYRTINDYVRLVKLFKVNLKLYKKSKYYNSFFENIEMMKENNNEYILINNLHRLRFFLRRKIKFYFHLDNLVCYFVEVLPKRGAQFIELFINSEYRKYVVNKTLTASDSPNNNIL